MFISNWVLSWIFVVTKLALVAAIVLGAILCLTGCGAAWWWRRRQRQGPD